MAITGFQREDQELLGLRKSRVKFVDLRTSEADIDVLRENYSFVDWANTDCYFSGFDNSALEMIFSDP